MTDPFGFVAHRPVTEQVLEGATRYFAVEEHTPSGWKIPQYDTQRQNGAGSCLWASEIEAFPIAVTRVRFEEGDQHGKQ